MLVSAYYVILQTSSSTHLSRRSTRDEWTPQSSYRLLVGPRGEVMVVSLIMNGYANIYKPNRRNHLGHKYGNRYYSCSYGGCGASSHIRGRMRS